MQPDSQTYLRDIEKAAGLLMQFTAGKTFDDYEGDPMLRAAVEREFEIIGEALSQLAKDDAETAGRITEYQRIIAFRNILAHGYARVIDARVWDLIETKLPALQAEVSALLAE